MKGKLKQVGDCAAYLGPMKCTLRRAHEGPHYDATRFMERDNSWE